MSRDFPPRESPGRIVRALLRDQRQLASRRKIAAGCPGPCSAAERTKRSTVGSQLACSELKSLLAQRLIAEQPRATSHGLWPQQGRRSQPWGCGPRSRRARAPRKQRTGPGWRTDQAARLGGWGAAAAAARCPPCLVACTWCEVPIFPAPTPLQVSAEPTGVSHALSQAAGRQSVANQKALGTRERIRAIVTSTLLFKGAQCGF